jgi:protein tyrosine phosphatase (PTP) superfamily phosphohydrolase (DUF442 family)
LINRGRKEMTAINFYYPVNIELNNKKISNSYPVIKNREFDNKTKKVAFQGISLPYTISYPIAKAWDLLSTKETPNLLNKISQVDKFLFRGPQPGIMGLEKLKKEGFDVVMSFKFYSKKQLKKMQEEAKRLNIKFINQPLNSFCIEKKEVKKILATIKDLQRKKLKTCIGCMHGIDRTGLISGLYEMKEKGRSFTEVHNKMLKMGHEKHRWLFPNIDKYLAQEANQKSFMY